ncbi:MAG: glycosyltransferase [Fervidobacterium sp.]
MCEGLSPLKLYESLACGIPVIVTDFPEISDIVRNGECGIVVKYNSPEEIAKAVRFLFENPGIRDLMGKKARKIAAEEHSWDKRAEQVDLILKHLVASNRNN